MVRLILLYTTTQNEKKKCRKDSVGGKGVLGKKFYGSHGLTSQEYLLLMSPWAILPP